MSGVWEALFYEEKQDWITCIVSSVTTLLSLLVDLPCTLLALISSTLILVWDHVCQGAQQVSDLLGLQEWWSLEHTLWVAGTLYMLSWASKKQKSQCLLLMLNHIQTMCVWGCFIFIINGVQGGVPFGGKLFHPTLAIFAVLLTTIADLLGGIGKELAGGLGHDEKIPDGKTKYLFEIMIKGTGYEASIALFIAVFGLPKFDLEFSDPASLLVLLPVLAMVWDGRKWQAELEKFDKVDANGSPPQVEAAKEAAAAEPEEKKAEEETKEEEPKAAEEEKKEEEEKKDGEAPAAAPEPAKPNPISQAIEAVVGLVSKVICLVKCAVNKVLDILNLIKDKILALPWDCIISTTTTLGTLAASTFAYWSLTEDQATLVSPVLAFVGPFLLSKMQEKSWLDAKGVHLGNEILLTSVAVIQYHLFRTYIALPI